MTDELTLGVSIAIPEPHATVLTGWRRRVGDPQADLIWPHVTLLGPTEVAPERLAVIEQHLAGAAGSRPPFVMHLSGTGTFEWIAPSGGVVGLVRFRPDVEVDPSRFYDVLLSEHGTYVGPGHWFELDDRHFRLGFGWPTLDELRSGLAGLSAAAEAATI